MYWNRQGKANSVDPKIKRHKTGLLCLPIVQQLLDRSIGRKTDLFISQGNYGEVLFFSGLLMDIMLGT